MSKYLLCFLLVICASCTRKTWRTNEARNKEDGSQYPMIAVLNIDDQDWVKKKSVNAELTAFDYIITDSLINACITEHNKKVALPRHGLSDREFCLLSLSLYRRQYIPFINVHGEKEIWVNCFYNSGNWHADWHKKLAMAMDGGNNYFKVKINLSAKKFYDLKINPYG